MFPKFCTKQILKFDPLYLEADADHYISLCYELYLDKSFEGMKEHQRANVAWGMTFSLEILKTIVLQKRKKSAYEFQFESKIFSLVYCMYHRSKIESHLEKLLEEEVFFDFSLVEEAEPMPLNKNRDLRDIGFMIFKGLASSVDFSADNTIMSLLLYKTLELLELTSQRFYCESFMVSK